MTLYPGLVRSLVASLSLAPLALALSGCGGTAVSVAPPSLLTVSYAGPTTGQITMPFTGAINVTGGTAPYSCALSSGTLPSGLSVDASACAITGTPSGNQPGNYTATVTASDSSATTRTGSASISLTISPAPLSITTTTLPSGAASVQYLAAIDTTGGLSPIACSLASGSADGLTVNSNCTLSGIPTATGTFSIAVKATDSSSPALTANATLSLIVSATPNTRVAAGTLPMIGASVQIYAAGTAGNGSAPTALLATPLTTDQFGSFTLPSSSSYTCPSPTAIVYFVATGGHAGVAGPTNPGAALMASPGACSTIATTANLVLDETSTAASVYTFAQFMQTGAKIGATSTNLIGITAAAAAENNLVPVATGLAASVGVASQMNLTLNVGGVTAQMKINLLANILNACVVGGTSSSACTTLFSTTTLNSVPPTNTLDAAMNLVQNPALAVAPLFALQPTSPVYTPTSTVAPADWTLAVTFTGGGMDEPNALGIDSQGRIWVASYYSLASLFTNTGVPVFPTGVGGNGLYHSYGGAVDANDDFIVTNEEGGSNHRGSVSGITSSGATLAGFPTTAGGIYYPLGISIDTNGLMWVADYGDSTLSILNPDGTSYAGDNGFTTSLFDFPASVAVDANHNGWVGDDSDGNVIKVSLDRTSVTSYSVGFAPVALAVDASDNIWTADYFDSGINYISSAGVVATPPPGFTSPSIEHPNTIAIDGNGNVWAANYQGDSITELAGAKASSPGAALSPPAGWALDAQIVQGYALAIDRSGDLWISNYGRNTLTEIVGLAAPVKTPQIGVVQKP